MPSSFSRFYRVYCHLNIFSMLTNYTKLIYLRFSEILDHAFSLEVSFRSMQ